MLEAEGPVQESVAENDSGFSLVGPAGIGTNASLASDDGKTSQEDGLTEDDINVTAQSLSAKVRELCKNLAGAIPIGFIPHNLAEMVRYNANERLDTARAQGVALEELQIGDDCLPTWPSSFNWDPENQTLHRVIQSRLEGLQTARDLGDLLQREIRIKSERRFGEALALGLTIDDIIIGPSLLPEWIAAAGGEEARGTPPTPPSSSSATMSLGEESSLDDDDGDGDGDGNYDDDAADAADEAAEAKTPRRRAHTLSQLDQEKDVSSSPWPTYLHNMVLDSLASLQQDPDSDSSSCSDASDIQMNNLVSAEPIYSDFYGHSNVIGDVEIVGVPGGLASADVQVFLAVDDSEDYEALPEVELAIDGDAFQRHFGDADVIDVDMAGGEMFCFSTVEEEGSEQEDDGEGQDGGDFLQTGRGLSHDADAAAAAAAAHQTEDDVDDDDDDKDDEGQSETGHGTDSDTDISCEE